MAKEFQGIKPKSHTAEGKNHFFVTDTNGLSRVFVFDLYGADFGSPEKIDHDTQAFVRTRAPAPTSTKQGTIDWTKLGEVIWDEENVEQILSFQPKGLLRIGSIEDSPVAVLTKTAEKSNPTKQTLWWALQSKNNETNSGKTVEREFLDRYTSVPNRTAPSDGFSLLTRELIAHRLCGEPQKTLVDADLIGGKPPVKVNPRSFTDHMKTKEKE